MQDNIPNPLLVAQLKRNIGVFVAFKNHHETKAIASLLYDKKGNIVPFTEFKKEAEKISNKYKKSWLKTEYNTANRRASFAVKFDEFQKQKHLYPNLEWTPSRSGSTRLEHEAYYGMIRSVDDPFWNTQYPGMLWNCKCGIKQTNKKITEIPDELEQAPAGIDENPWVSKSIFNSSHPYFKGLSDEEIKDIRKKLDEVIPTIPYPVNPAFKAKGKVFIHPFADPNEIELERSYKSAKILANNYPLDIKLRHHVSKKSVPNPDYIIDGLTAELKHSEGGLSGLKTGFSTGINQGAQIFVFKMEETSTLTVDKIWRKINGEIVDRTRKGKLKQKIERIYIIDLDENVFEYVIK